MLKIADEADVNGELAIGAGLCGLPQLDLPAPPRLPVGVDLSVLAHEVRAPLGGILGLASMLLDTPLDSAQRATVHTIRTGAEHLAAVLDRYLPAEERARHVAGAPVPFDPAVLASTVVRLLEPQASTKGINLAVVGHRHLPTLAGADPVALRQVLVNLASNAIRVTDEGSVTIRVRPERGIQALRFEIVDTGPGLTDSLRAALAGPTGCDDSPTGIGIGLSRRLVLAMGGVLDATANAGGGATVWCSIPYIDVRQPPPGDPPPGNLARVLVAEDDELNAQVALTLLERLGYCVDLVGTGTDALRAWRTHSYDVCIVDVNVTELDGYDVTRCIRELERAGETRTPIIGLTAGSQAAERDRCVAAGMDAQLAKPIELRTLVEVLGRFAPPRR